MGTVQRSRRLRWRPVALLVVVLVACGDDDDADEQATGGDDGAAAAAAAAALFATKGCAECHGAEGEGMDRPNSELAGTRLIIQQFSTRVRNGKGSAMPGYGPEQLTDEEIRALWEWLRAAQR